jgi:hypothetical protein
MEFKYTTLFIVIILILAGFAAYSSLLTDLSSQPEYNITISSEFSQAYTNLSDLKGQAISATGLVVNISDASDNATFIENDYTDPSKTQIKPVKMAKASYNILKSFVLITASVLNIPPLISVLILLFLLLALVLSFIGLIFRYIP